MKKYSIVLFFVVISFSLSACAGKAVDEPDPLKIPSFIPVGESVVVDLNADGKKETISYSLDDFTVNGISYKDLIQQKVYENNPMGDNYLIADIQTTDAQKEIGLGVDGPSSDPETHFFTYDGEKLIEIGGIPTAVNDLTEAFDGMGSICGLLRLNILQTWWAPADWELSSDNTIELKGQSIYYPIQYTPEVPIALNVPLPIYENIDDSSSFLTMEPQEVKLTATDNLGWCKIEGAAGTEGWFKIDHYNMITDLGIDGNTVFSNLCMAD